MDERQKALKELAVHRATVIKNLTEERNDWREAAILLVATFELIREGKEAQAAKKIERATEIIQKYIDKEFNQNEVIQAVYGCDKCNITSNVLPTCGRPDCPHKILR